MTGMYDSEMPEITIKCPTRFHLPCVILIDKSGSMNGEPIYALNKALIDFKDQFKADNEDHYVIDICIIAFGGKGDGSEPDIQILQEFAPANEMFYTAELKADGGTPLAQAVDIGLGEIARIRRKYRDCGVDYYRPWLVCITDGESTEDREYYNCVKVSLKKETEGKHVIPYGIGVGDCNYRALYDFFGEGYTFRLENGKFKELFNYWKDILYIMHNAFSRPPQVPQPIDSEGNRFLFPVAFDDDSEEDSDDNIADSEQTNEVFADDSETGDADEKSVFEKNNIR